LFAYDRADSVYYITVKHDVRVDGSAFTLYILISEKRLDSIVD